MPHRKTMGVKRWVSNPGLLGSSTEYIYLWGKIQYRLIYTLVVS